MRTPLDARPDPPTDIDALEEWATDVSRSELARAAESMVVVRDLAPFPSWRFGIEEETADAVVARRLVIWRAFLRRRIRRPLTIPWYHGVQLNCWLGNDLSRCLFVGSCIEPNELSFIASFLSSGMTFIDGGANEGLFTLLAAPLVGPTGTVVAIEPSPRELRRLRYNVKTNRFRNVKIVPSALGEQVGDKVLRVAAPEHSGQNTLGKFSYPTVHQSSKHRVKIEPLDDLVSRLQLNRVDLLKLDVEGSELKALQGAARTIEIHRPVILLEAFDAALKHQGSSLTDVLKLLKAKRYEILVFSSETGLPVPRRRRRQKLSANVVAVPMESPMTTAGSPSR